LVLVDLLCEATTIPKKRSERRREVNIGRSHESAKIFADFLPQKGLNNVQPLESNDDYDDDRRR
jgi:hypothetical protein